MTISIQVECACGKKERVEINDDEDVPEQCRECKGSEAPLAPDQQQGEALDMWNLTTIPSRERKRRPMH